MAIEARRGCGFRKVGGIYLVAGGAGVPCDRLPFPLTICPTCHAGFKQTRSWTTVDLKALVGSAHSFGECRDRHPEHCPLCSGSIEKAGLLWVGEGFYKTPADFTAEANALGISRRIKTIPKDLKIGETWVLLAHPKAVPEALTPEDLAIENQALAGDTDALAKVLTPAKPKGAPGIFRAFKPERIEILVTESQKADAEYVAKLEKRGLTLVVVPDGDTDHQGSVYDKEDEKTEPAIEVPQEAALPPDLSESLE